MRSEAELVIMVEYFSAANSDDLPWLGIFKPTSDMDKYFADAEPPAHDSWDPTGVEDPMGRSYVNVALRRIKEEVKRYLAPAQTSNEPIEGRSTGGFVVLVGESCRRRPWWAGRPRSVGEKRK